MRRSLGQVVDEMRRLASAQRRAETAPLVGRDWLAIPNHVEFERVAIDYAAHSTRHEGQQDDEALSMKETSTP